MNTLTLDCSTDQPAIVKNSGFSENKLFKSTVQAIQFWLEAATNKENLPTNAYLNFLQSIGWSPRNAAPYIRLANFIRQNLIDRLDTIAKLDIRTLLKLPRIRYASIVTAIQNSDLSQRQVTELIKKLPPKPKPYKSTEQRDGEVTELNLPIDTKAALTETAELAGISQQKAISLGCELLRAIASGQSLADIVAKVQSQINFQTSESGSESDTTIDNDTIIEVAEIVNSDAGEDTWQADQSELAEYLDTQVQKSDDILEFTTQLQHLSHIINRFSQPNDESERLILRVAIEDRAKLQQSLATLHNGVFQ